MSLYRPTACARGSRKFSSRSILVEGVRHRVVFTPDLDVDVRLTHAATHIHQANLADRTCPGYIRGALEAHSQWFAAGAHTASGAFSPWGPPEGVQQLFKELLEARGATVTPSKSEKNVWHIEAPDEEIGSIASIVSGLFHSYAICVEAGIYEWPNPFEVPTDDRISRRIPGVTRSGYPVIVPRFRFRVPQSAASALRCDDTELVRLIVPALIAYGVPPSIVFMVKVLIEGLSRIAEQINISVWDWFESDFGESFAMTNKGRRKKRVKTQWITPGLVAELHEFFDGARRALDPNGWGIDQWREFLTDPTISKAQRMKAAKAAPLFPSKSGGFYSRSGVLDVWYRPAMRSAGLPTRSHYPRHCGVNHFLAYVDARPDLTNDEKQAAKLAFARSMGWKWPDVMLDRYSLPQRRSAEITATREWRLDMRKHLQDLASGIGRPPLVHPLQPTQNDVQLSRLARHRMKEAA